MMAIQGDNNISSLDEEEEEGIMKICLMSHKYGVNIENSFEFTFEELLEIFHELMDDFKKIRQKNKELKRSNLFLV